MNEIKEYIRSAFKLSEEEAIIFLSEVSKVELKRNDVFAVGFTLGITVGKHL